LGAVTVERAYGRVRRPQALPSKWASFRPGQPLRSRGPSERVSVEGAVQAGEHRKVLHVQRREWCGMRFGGGCDHVVDEVDALV